MNICKICNTSDRYKSGKCKKCSRERCKSYDNKNKDKIKEYQKEYQKKNKDVAIKRMSDWRKNNPDRYRQNNIIYHEKNKEIFNKRSAEYRRKNPEKVKKIINDWCNKNRERLNKAKNKWVKENTDKVKVTKQNNRIKRLSASGKLSSGLFDNLIISQENKCVYCKYELDKVVVHMDHIMPIKLGGENIDSNMQLLCQSCNVRKSAKHPDVFAKEIKIRLGENNE